MMINQVLEEIVLPSPASLGKEKGRWGVCKPCVFAGIWQTPTPTLGDTHTGPHAHAIQAVLAAGVVWSQSHSPSSENRRPLPSARAAVQGAQVQSVALFKKYSRAGGPPMQSTYKMHIFDTCTSPSTRAVTVVSAIDTFSPRLQGNGKLRNYSLP
jgi:hypothetical protein